MSDTRRTSNQGAAMLARFSQATVAQLMKLDEAPDTTKSMREQVQQQLARHGDTSPETIEKIAVFGLTWVAKRIAQERLLLINVKGRMELLRRNMPRKELLGWLAENGANDTIKEEADRLFMIPTVDTVDQVDQGIGFQLGSNKASHHEIAAQIDGLLELMERTTPEHIKRRDLLLPRPE